MTLTGTHQVGDNGHTTDHNLIDAQLAELSGTSAQVVNARSYGAVGNGVTDDTASIQSAINAASTAASTTVPTGPVTVYLPPGRYKLSSALTVTTSRVHIVGAGTDATTLLLTNATQDGLVLGNGTTACLYLSVRDLTIDANVTKTAGTAIKCQGLYRSTFEDVNLFRQFRGYLFDPAAADSSFNVVERGFWGDFTAATGIGAEILGGSEQHFNNIVGDNAAGARPHAAIRVQNSMGSVLLNGCDFLGYDYGLLCDPGNGQIVYWLFIINSAFDSGGNTGIMIRPTGTGKVLGGEFTACWSATQAVNGVAIGGGGGTVDGIRFVGLRCYTNSGAGVLLQSGATNIRFSGCDISGNSYPTNGGVIGAQPGIYVSGGVSQWSVVDCCLGATGGQFAYQGWGIFIDSGASDNFIIAGNDLTGSLTAPISDLSTGTHKVIKNNLTGTALLDISPQCYTPTDLGFKAVSLDPRYLAGTGASPAAGTVQTVRVPLNDYVATGGTLGVQVLVVNGGTGATSLANCYVGVYDATTNALLGVSTDQSTAWGSNGVKEVTLTFTAAKPSGHDVIVALLVGTQSTTAVTLARAANSAAQAEVFSGRAFATKPLFGTADTGRTTLPSTLGTQTAQVSAFFAGLF